MITIAALFSAGLYPQLKSHFTLEQIPTFNVTFEPGCRNNWHIHHAANGGGRLLRRHG